MRTTITYQWDAIQLPDNAKLGDTFTFTARATVTQVEHKLLTVEAAGGERSYTPAEDEATISLDQTSIERR